MKRFLPLIPLLMTLVLAACDYTIVEQEPSNPVGPGNGNGANVAIVVTPGVATVRPGGNVSFRAIVTGAADTSAIWSVVSGPGQIYPDGRFIAPDTLASTTIRAVATADTTKSATASITITNDSIALPVDPNRICFDRDILPLFRSNCAMAGCHDPLTRQEGYDFTTAIGIRSGVVPGNSHASEIYEMITGAGDDDNDDNDVDDGDNDIDDDDNDVDDGDNDDDFDIMPPPPRAPLSAAQIDLIRRWIDAGADTTTCPTPGGGGGGSNCDTVNVFYSSTVRPVLATNCLGCHTGGSSYNKNIDLSTHAGVQRAAQSGHLIGAISHASGYTPMPYGGGKLDDCTIAKIKAWVARGAPNN